jgi:hypothetical protein
MRLPAGDVVRQIGGAVRTGRPGLEGMVRALPDVPAALLRRRTVPAEVHADLRTLAGEAGA